MSDQVRIEMVFQPTDTKREFDKVEKQAEKAGTKASISFSKGFSKSIKTSMQSVRNDIIGTVGAFMAFNTVKNVLVDATKASMGFEQAIAEVNTIMPKNTKLTEQQIKVFKDFAKQFGTSSQAQVKSYYDIVSAGVTDTAKAQSLLAAANKLSIGGLTSVGASVDILTSILNGYGQENISAADAADSLFTAVKLGKTTVDQLASSLAKVVPGARAMGVNLDTVNSAMAVLTSNGIGTAEAVTMLNALFTAFATKGAQLGKSLDSNALISDGFITVLQRMQKQTGGASDQLNKLLGSSEAVRAAQVLMRGNAKAMTDAMEQMTTKTGAADKAFQTMADTNANKIKILTAEFNALTMSIAEGVAPALLRVVSGFRTLGAMASDALGGKQATTVAEDYANRIDALTLKLADLHKRSRDLKAESAMGVGLIRGLVLPGKIDDVTSAIQETTMQLEALKRQKESFAQGAELEQLRQAQSEYDNYLAQQKLITAEKQAQKQAETEAMNQKILELEALKAIQEQERLDSLNSQQIFTEATQSKFESLVGFFGQSGKRMSTMASEMANATFNALSNGVGKAFQDVGKALASGENAFEAFGNALKGILAEVASAIGDTFIKWGIANLVSGNVGMGAAQIAAGGALKILSGALGSSSQGSGGGGASSAPTATTPITVDDGGINEFQETAEREVGTNVELVVQGSLVHQDELSIFLAESLSEGFEKQGVTLTDARLT